MCGHAQEDETAVSFQIFGTRRMALAAMVLMSSSCNPIEPSAESTRLQTDFIPKIVQWSKGSELELKLARVFDLSDYKSICIVPDYNCLDSVKNSATVGIIDYNSSFGKCVPENHLAFMVIGRDRAHAAILDKDQVHFDVLAHGTCANASTAVLRKRNDRPGRAPLVVIGDK